MAARCHSAVNAEQACWLREAILTAQAYGIVPPERNTPDIPGVTSPALQMTDTLSAWLDERAGGSALRRAVQSSGAGGDSRWEL